MATDAIRLLQYMERNKSEMIEYLRELAIAESPSFSAELQDGVLNMLAVPLRELGYECRRLPGKQSGGQLYAHPSNFADGQPSQLLLGHCDTVWPEGTIDEMPVTVEADLMTGPGVYDMKVGLTQIVFSLKALHDLGMEPPLTPLVFISSDEELGSAESKGEIEALARKVDRVFIPEPSTEPDGRLKTARKGVGVYTIIVEGKSAHAGVDPQNGVSAVLELPAIIEKLQSLNDSEKNVTLNIGLIEAGTRTNIVPDRCEIGIDVRVPTVDDGNCIDAAVHGLGTVQPGTQIEVCGGIERPPMEKTPRNQALWKVAQKLGSQLGIRLEESYTGGGSDGNLTSPFTATLDGLGGVGGGAHAKHEFVKLDKMVERSALLALLLMAPDIPDEAK